MSSSFSLGLHAAGLIVIYSGYGALQERILRGTYSNGSEDVRFTSSSLLILCNRIFSIAVGTAILAYKTRGARLGGSGPTLVQRLKPASPLFAYAAVAVFNFLSTTCQYEALKYVSYTTQSLAKCAKMVPVLITGALIYKKSYATKEWAAGAIILIGCATYLFSNPPASKHGHALAADEDSMTAGLFGTFFLCGYLFFDGLVSTTQERVFGKNPSSSDPFGPESPVLDQMVWTNLFAGLIAICSCVVTSFSGSLLPDLQLLLTTPALWWDVMIFSAASALGLIVLLNTIASFGALTCSLIMTTRQFLSILINAGIFGNFGAVGMDGWTGVGWVASGIFIKMNKKYDPPKQPKKPKGVATKAGDAVNSEELHALAIDVAEKELAAPPPPLSTPEEQRRRYFFQYGLPVLFPVALAVFISVFFAAPSRPVNPILSRVKVGSYNGTSLLGGKWESEVYTAVAPTACDEEKVTKRYDGKGVKTALVSFPRSGTTFVRGLVERTTGFRTSSEECDPKLQAAFLGECDAESKFLVNSHFPTINPGASSLQYFKEFDQAVHLVRNPLDAIASYYRLRNPYDIDDPSSSAPTEGISAFSAEQRSEVLVLAREWTEHAEYWKKAPLLTQTVRYEDLKRSPMTKLMGLLAFLLPSGELPSLSEISCTVASKEELGAYKSRHTTDFSSYSTWDADLRREVLAIAKRPFCSLGYDKLLIASVGKKDLEAGMEKFCASLPFRMVIIADENDDEEDEDEEEEEEGK